MKRFIILLCFLLCFVEAKALDMSSMTVGMAIGGSGPDEKIINIKSKSLIRVCQEALNNAGFKVKVDGMYGEETEQAVMNFQKNNNLKIDGLIGKETLILLIRYIR